MALLDETSVPLEWDPVCNGTAVQLPAGGCAVPCHSSRVSLICMMDVQLLLVVTAAIAAAMAGIWAVNPSPLEQPTAVAYWQATALNTPAWDLLTNATGAIIAAPARATLIVTQSMHPDFEAADIAAKHPAVPHVYGAMRGISYLGNKAHMALMLKAALPQDELESLIPPTYILSEMEDLKQLDAVQPGARLYYFKSYIHAQHKVRITKDPAAVLREAGTPYIVAQQILERPLTVHSVKTTLRLFLLLVANSSALVSYVAKDGVVYYANEPYVEGSQDPDVIVANSYPITPEYPAFATELQDALSAERWQLLWSDALRVVTAVMQASHAFIQQHNMDIPEGHVRSIILGVDLMPLENFAVKLLEVNAAPHLGILYKCQDEARKYFSVEFAARLLCGGLHLAGSLHCPASSAIWVPLNYTASEPDTQS